MKNVMRTFSLTLKYKYNCFCVVFQFSLVMTSYMIFFHLLCFCFFINLQFYALSCPPMSVTLYLIYHYISIKLSDYWSSNVILQNGVLCRVYLEMYPKKTSSEAFSYHIRYYVGCNSFSRGNPST